MKCSDGGGAFIEDTVLVTDTGVEILTVRHRDADNVTNPGRVLTKGAQTDFRAASSGP